MESTYAFRDDYNISFRPEEYLTTYYSSIEGCAEEGNLVVFYLENYLRYFQQRKPSEPNVRVSWLDFGSGPTVWSFCFAPHNDPGNWDIVLSDYSMPNRNALEIFIKNSPLAHNWQPYFSSAAHKLENLSIEDSNSIATARIDWLRASKPQVVFADALAERVINTDIDPIEAFDLITTNLCLEAAADSKETFMESLRKLSAMVKRGGDLLMSVVENEKFYSVSTTKFAVVPVKPDWIESVLTSPEWSCSIERIPMTSNIVSDFDAALFVRAHRL
jgi:hypothetical protein